MRNLQKLAKEEAEEISPDHVYREEIEGEKVDGDSTDGSGSNYDTEEEPTTEAESEDEDLLNSSQYKRLVRSIT